MNHAVALLLVLLLAGCDQPAAPSVNADPTTAAAEPKPQALPTTDLKLGQRTFTLQIAANDTQREFGLMYTHSMPADRGMIFLFPAERVQQFWMQHTPIDLDILYVDHANKITAIKTMHAFDETSVSSDDPADVAIELNAGAARQSGLSVGDTLEIPSGLRRQAR